MAFLGIVDTFEAYHGTTQVYLERYGVSLTLEGTISGDFVSNIDYGEIRSYLHKLISTLDGKRLDDIVGRATVENVSLYIAYQLRTFGCFELIVHEGSQVFVRLRSTEVDWPSYEPQLYLKRGKSFALRKRYEQAVTMFNAVLESYPLMTNAYICRGRCWKHLGEYNLALEDFSKAIELNPNFGEAYRNRGNIRMELHDTNEMLTDFDHAVRLMPNSALTMNNRGFAYQSISRYDLAVPDHTRAIALNPDYAEAYRDRASAYAALNMIEQAKSDFEKADALGYVEDDVTTERHKLDAQA